MANKLLLFSIASVALSMGIAYAQTGAAQVQGIVSDSSGAVIPNAVVLLENPQTGRSEEHTSELQSLV